MIKEELGVIISREIELAPGEFITVMRTQVSPTLEHSTVWVSIYPDERAKSILALLNRQILSVQRKLNTRLRMRVKPKIQFKIDYGQANVQRVEELLKKEVE